MRWTLMLQLLQLLLQLLMAQSQSLERISQDRIPLFRLTQQGDWDSLDRHPTDSLCVGLPAAGVTTLNLANRSLESLPSCLPRTLRSLDGSHNLLRALSEPVLGRLPELRVLTLHHNRISVLHWGRDTLAELRELDLSHNLLTELPPCAGPSGSSLRSLALAGNPLRALLPRTFACFPALRLLNLSCSELGHIAQEAFAGVDGGPLAALELLDLSGTSLERVESGWIRNLPKLKSLFLRKMPRLKTLEGDIFKMTPNLRQLDCGDSPALTSVHTEIFQDTPNLQVLQFQNCNLSSFGPWNSSQVLSVSLFGNPLICSCELAWLLVDVNKTVLHRAADTMCEPALGSTGPFSGPLSLSHLSNVCRSDQSTTLLPSNPGRFDHSVFAPRIQGPSIEQSTALSAQPGGSQQNITKVPSLTMTSPTQGSWMYKDASEETAQSTNSELVYSPSRALPGAASSGAEQTATHILEPNISSASTPLVSKYLEPLPTSPNPRSLPQTKQRTQATPRALHTDPPQDEIPVLLLDDDSEEEETRDQVAAPPQDVSCEYHPCKHLQTPCAELQRRFRCRCPGLSGEDTTPDPPTLQGVSEVTDTSVLVHWCAPNSVVLWYQIHYVAEGRSGNQSVVDIYATARQHPLYKLTPGTTYHVCVLAANRAGLSQSQTSGWRRSCATFTTKPSSVVIFWGLCTASGLLLVSTLVLSVCLWRQRWKPHRQFYDTHLVAFKNPARAEEVTQWE
ncbi:leucine-rich repeat neuronal protein 4 isoform X1 [Mus musculus]|uniref:Leucine-rich repeat neuronal protein 4 n=1 Tax=Mus musculus TaxID=10090 RepID=LRRN4_MOUSE|nr:leucine-rich repeat neuronal protein 4 precursor [Mus musculus]XP_011237904.1 leucine-rich repeat neuronal protein 4 isoform X1 [Mus musculus]P59383.2 RecName: Full=Leucine-rich repeat neuronal protein 4; AltName: Full=Neuronal leucine-rich repeat protein 4; Short=NLRR-4; Flags: Precursor [Mus musculus]AAI66014.1 Leucine rich repeat neuronal 4 [synthetic construct]BAC38065.1 unnamed protein product [Mus musculus]|eukprot:NP_796277.2 leucine-rich repeat neuronal protein 4 precursor [Mus musculus]